MKEYYEDKIDNLEFQKKPLPSGLNVITILSIIWSCILIIGSMLNVFTAKINYDKREETLAQMNSDKMPSFVKGMMGSPEKFMDLVTKSYENRWPIAIIGLVAAVLCLVGAIQMRKLKKQGYMLYVIGEVLQFIPSILFIGAAAISGGFYFMVAIAALFIFLYTNNRKHLVN